ncbi:hypothetical protein [Rhizobacter fulvus]
MTVLSPRFSIWGFDAGGYVLQRTEHRARAALFCGMQFRCPQSPQSEPASSGRALANDQTQLMLSRNEIWLWFIRDEVTGKLRISRHRITADDAETLHPGATQVPGSMEFADLQMTKDAELSVTMDTWSRGRVQIPG